MPCISTVVPWEAWYYGRGAKPATTHAFKWTYHFCFGVAAVRQRLHHDVAAGDDQQEGRRHVAQRCRRQRHPAALGPLLTKAGYTIVDPGAYTDGTNDYSSQITKFKSAGCEIFNTFPIPPDFATFWQQAAPAGLQAEDRADRQDRPLPVAGRGARRDRRRPRRRRLLGADLALQLVADGCRRADLGAGYETCVGQAMEPAARREPRALRRRGRGAQGVRQPQGQGGGRHSRSAR